MRTRASTQKARPNIPKASVGNRSDAEVQLDPLATPEEIERLSWQDPLSALSHPNCPLPLWKELAAECPMEAPSTPAGQLFLLEHPGLWGELERANLSRWIEKYSAWGSREGRRLFAVECAERVLPLFEAKYPADDRPRCAIAAARAYAQGIGSEDAMMAARGEAIKAHDHASRKGHQTAAAEACGAAHAAASTMHQMRLVFAYAAEAAGSAAAEIAFGQSPLTKAFQAASNAAEHEERRWQWARLQEYVQSLMPQKEVPQDKGKVGGRKHTAVQADPQATAREITSMSQTKPIEALQHPNCPIELWWKLARHYPLEAMASMLFDLMTMEAPERWVRLEQSHAKDWMKYVATRGLLSDQKMRLLVADIAEHVLPLFEQRKRQDASPRSAIETARLFAQGQATDQEMSNASVLATHGAKDVGEDNAAESAGLAAAWCASPVNIVQIIENTSYSAAWAAHYARGRTVDALNAEYAWQWQRFLAYLRGEAP